MAARPRYYRVYGLSLKSALPLPCPVQADPVSVTAELAAGSAPIFAKARAKAANALDDARWFQQAPLADGSTYLRWSGLFEFLISPAGRRITCRALNGASQEAFHAYLVSQVLSFALLKRGVEPLHATVAVVNGQAVAFLGDSGYGKSSLGAAFLRAGHRLLTDDLLVITEADRRFIAHPGPPRIKLFPEIAKTFLGEGIAGVPMNPKTTKLVIPLASRLSAQTAAPLQAIYALRPPLRGVRRKRITIRPLSQRRACLELIANTFNPVIVEPDRLARQFCLAARLVGRIPVKSLSYPRDLARLPAVVESIQADLAS
jgi:hypothetical protein